MSSLFEGGTASALPRTDVGLRDIAAFTCVGGWPGSLHLAEEQARSAVGDYLNEIVRLDVPLVSGIQHHPAAVRRLLRSLARHVATEAKTAKLASDAGGDRPLGRHTVGAYLDALDRIFVVEDQPAWSVGLRSRATLRKAPKRHFVDPSLAASMLRASPQRLLADPKTFGLFFESLVVRDLRVYGQPARCEISHYRDSDGLEVDAIVRRADGPWIAVEVKLGGEPAIHQAVRTLGRLRKRVDASRTGEPARLVVVTAGGYGYEHPDGVTVVPITALGP